MRRGCSWPGREFFAPAIRTPLSIATINAARGVELKGVRLITFDACIGLTESVAEFFPEAARQRCIVHWYRNIFSHVKFRGLDGIGCRLRWQSKKGRRRLSDASFHATCSLAHGPAGMSQDDIALIEWIRTEVEGGYIVREKDFQFLDRDLKQLRDTFARFAITQRRLRRSGPTILPKRSWDFQVPARIDDQRHPKIDTRATRGNEDEREHKRANTIA